MTIIFTQPGDVAAQVYNEAKRAGFSDKEAAAASWDAMQHARENQGNEEDSSPSSADTTDNASVTD